MTQPDHSVEPLHTYVLGERLSYHQNREVFLAQNAQGQTVILKRLQMGQLSDWKAMELFEREARTLQTLRHPRIPLLLDFFHTETSGQVVLTMVMEYVQGISLAQRLQQGWRPKEAEVLDIARQGLEILDSLHRHDPPVIHRDIKPSNLIWTDSQELYLIDFGAVRDIFIRKNSSTVIGTFGYMAPEQFAGQTVPASDLYGLGATLLHLLSGRSPSEIPQKHLMPDFRAYVTCSVEMQRLLERLLVPDLEERLPDAQAALTELKSLSSLREVSPSRRMVYLREGENISLQLRPSLNPIALWQQYKPFLLGITGYGMMNLLILNVCWNNKLTLAGGIEWNPIFLGYGLVSSLVLLLALWQTAKMARERFVMQLTPETLILEQQYPLQRKLPIPRKAIVEVNREITQTQLKLSRAGISLNLIPGSALQMGQDQLDIAMGLSKPDQHWLMTKLWQYARNSQVQSAPPPVIEAAPYTPQEAVNQPESEG